MRVEYATKDFLEKFYYKNRILDIIFAEKHLLFIFEVNSYLKKRMDYYSVPSDQLMCLTKTVVVIFNRRDMKECLHELGRQFLYPHGHLDCIAKKGEEFASTIRTFQVEKHIDRLASIYGETRAQALVQRQDADISSRFKIASSYLWLDDMQRLHEESPDTCKGLLASFRQGTMMNYWEGRHFLPNQQLWPNMDNRGPLLYL
ncbi:hypothetical protein CDAR_199341 [Caerostris darwini]|uniref:Uncharacterized protein n=1 Tax=Caerostris darwini TaxID=1538125 RepID=A0AAV4R2G2_9ARAC|nr:hypothetical protein CDAR_199341 [Caerostris darwini]